VHCSVLEKDLNLRTWCGEDQVVLSDEKEAGLSVRGFEGSTSHNSLLPELWRRTRLRLIQDEEGHSVVQARLNSDENFETQMTGIRAKGRQAGVETHGAKKLCKGALLRARGIHLRQDCHCRMTSIQTEIDSR